MMITTAWYIRMLSPGYKVRMGSLKEPFLLVKTRACLVSVCPVQNLKRKIVAGE